MRDDDKDAEMMFTLDMDALEFLMDHVPPVTMKRVFANHTPLFFRRAEADDLRGHWVFDKGVVVSVQYDGCMKKNGLLEVMVLSLPDQMLESALSRLKEVFSGDITVPYRCLSKRGAIKLLARTAKALKPRAALTDDEMVTVAADETGVLDYYT